MCGVVKGKRFSEIYRAGSQTATVAGVLGSVEDAEFATGFAVWDF